MIDRFDDAGQAGVNDSPEDQDTARPESVPTEPPWPHVPPVLKSTSHLAAHAKEYEREHNPRPSADPIGLGGLPDRREDLDELLLELCRRLIATGARSTSGKRLVEEFNGRLRDTRSLRELVAYGHVHHRLRQIVGVPGSGYVWGDCNPIVYETMSVNARKMGRCFLFNSALYKCRPLAVEAAQLLLDFAAPDRQGDQGDELSALMAAEGVGIEQVLGTVVEMLSASDQGRQTLRSLGRRHAGVLIDPEVVHQMERKIQGVLDELKALATAG